MFQTKYGLEDVRNTRHKITTGAVVKTLVGCSGLGSKSKRLIDSERREMHCLHVNTDFYTRKFEEGSLPSSSGQ